MTLSAAVAGAAIGDLVVLCNDVGATGTDKSTTTASSRRASSPSPTPASFENIAGATYRRWRATKLTAAR
jgi:hypothetical protein